MIIIIEMNRIADKHNTTGKNIIPTKDFIQFVYMMFS